jgi:hypothetical protein
VIDPSEIARDDIQALIRKKAKRIVGCAGFRSPDQADLEQQLNVCLLKVLPAFDPARGTFQQFANKILGNARANILRDQSALKRQAGTVVSLSQPRKCSTECDYTDVPEACSNGRLVPLPVSQEHYCDLRLDVAAMVEQLPAESRAIAEALKRHTVTKAARVLGMPRTTLIAKLGPEGALFEKLKRFAENSRPREVRFPKS